jgi:hypothetical protein
VTKVLHLWLLPDLMDPKSRPYPLAIWKGDAIQWVAGAREGLHPALAEIVEALPHLLATGVRFNQRGLASGNIQEREPFEVDDAGHVLRTLPRTAEEQALEQLMEGPGGGDWWRCVQCGCDYPRDIVIACFTCSPAAKRILEGV